MAEERTSVRDVQVRDFLPWLSLFRAFGIAIDPRKLLLAAAGLMVMGAGWWLLGGLFDWVSSDPNVEQQAVEMRRWAWEDSTRTTFSVPAMPDQEQFLDQIQDQLKPAARDTIRARLGEKKRFDMLPELMHSPIQTLWRLATNWRYVLRPYEDLLRPFRTIFSRGWGFVPVVFAFLSGVWAVVVWAFFGGAITRIAAVQFARDEKISLREAISFARSRYLSYVGGPVIPLGFIGFLAVFCLLGGSLSVIGWGIGRNIGPVIAGLLWFLPLVAGFVMAIILLGWAVGWPLMFSTISVEGSDTFDAISRSYAYVFQRPWHYLFYAIVLVIFGSLCSFFVVLLGDLLVHLSLWAVALGAAWTQSWPDWLVEKRALELIHQLTYYAPPASGWQVRDVAGQKIDEPTGAAWFGAVCSGVWLYLLFLLLAGFVYSYFWSASTAMYYLLRRDVDNTELEEVYLEGAEDDFEPPGQEGLGGASGGGASERQPSGVGPSPTPTSPK